LRCSASRADPPVDARAGPRHGRRGTSVRALDELCGAGRGLYGERDVDTRIVRERFSNVPLQAFSTFEIGPRPPPSHDLYTTVVAMFGAPS
jgi:small ligand-binding sensory domain FIST